MKTYRKIDLYFSGDYLCSTNQAKTCKQAIADYLARIRQGKYYAGNLDIYILKNPKYLKARFFRG